MSIKKDVIQKANIALQHLAVPNEENLKEVKRQLESILDRVKSKQNSCNIAMNRFLKDAYRD